MERPAWPGLLDRGYKRVLFVVAAGLLGSGLGLLVLLVLVQPWIGSWREQPVSPWKKLPQPPVPLSHFVADAYENTLDGQVYASTADGTLYALDCSGKRCVWSKREAIPPPTDAGESWCLDLDTEDRPRGMPTALGRVMDTYAWRNCVHDFWIDSHYILLDDGSVWVWESYEYLRFRIFDEKLWKVMRVSCCGGSGLVLGLLLAFVVLYVASKRSRPIS